MIPMCGTSCRLLEALLHLDGTERTSTLTVQMRSRKDYLLLSIIQGRGISGHSDSYALLAGCPDVPLTLKGITGWGDIDVGKAGKAVLPGVHFTRGSIHKASL